MADAALNFGSYSLAEECMKLSQQKEKLMHHYAITGQMEKLKKIEIKNVNERFSQTLLTGDIRERVKILAETGQVALAYASAKLHGLEDFVETLE